MGDLLSEALDFCGALARVVWKVLVVTARAFLALVDVLTYLPTRVLAGGGSGGGRRASWSEYRARHRRADGVSR